MHTRRPPRLLAALAAAALVALSAAGAASAAAADPIGHAPPFRPIDPQAFVLPDQQTWADYRPVPGTSWGDPALAPTVKKWKAALVLVDFPDQPFVISQPAQSTIFGNPQPGFGMVPREEVPEFYADLLNTPQAANNFVTMNKYWMENSLGRYGVELVPFGPYRMEGNAWEYHLRDAGNAGSACPTGFLCNRQVRPEALAAWRAEQGATIDQAYDNIFYVMAGQDESGSWQEFGEMMFETQDDVTEEFGNPDPTKPNWAPTRYVPWTSFASATSIWPSAGGKSSTEAESSGMAVFAHELSHNLGIGDNYNNPYGIPLRRTYTGPWDMLSRGSFNGPGGPHTRWHIPSLAGSSLGSNHNLRNRMRLGFVTEDNVLRLDAGQLAASGPVVARITARAADPGPTGLTGVNVVLPGGDQTPPCSLATTPDCPATENEQRILRYQNYTLEVVQQLGNDSFTPGHGVLISRTKNTDRSPFVWIIDAHPEDFDEVDFLRPVSKTPAMVSYGDYRQLADATFNAGLGSGSRYEYVDEANRLHFSVIDVEADAAGVLTYTVGIRSLDGGGPQARGVALADASTERITPAWAADCRFPLTNSGADAAPAGSHPEGDVSGYTDGDVFRLETSLAGEGWTAQLYNALATAEFGQTTTVPVYVTRTPGSSNRATVTLRATSEGDTSQTATSTCALKVSDLNEQ